MSKKLNAWGTFDMEHIFLVLVWIALCANGYWVSLSNRGSALSNLAPVLIAVCLTTAIFAINFSFYQYQTSPYKELRRKFSPVHIRLAILIFLLSILPLLALIYAADFVVALSLTLIPTIGVFGFVLLVIAKTEVDVVNMIKGQASKKNISRFLKEYSCNVTNALSKVDNISLSDVSDTPTHEWQWIITPPQPPHSPLMLIESANFLIVKNGDVTSFSSLYEIALDLVGIIFEFKPKHLKNDDYRIRRVLAQEAARLLNRVCIDALKSDDSSSFSRVIINQTSERLVTQASQFHQTEEYSSCLLSLLDMVGMKSYERGFADIAISVISLSRSIVNKGLDRPNMAGIDCSLYRHALPYLTYPIRHLGSQAVKKSDSETLYRCLDAYAWLGCAATKKLNYGVAKECLRSLAQLGREARSQNLECFWSRCSISPWEHAEERIKWILTWVPKIDPLEWDVWIGVVAEAYQRLTGHQVEIKIEEKDGVPNCKINEKEETYIVGYWDHGQEREIDYSDFSFLKDMEMY